ncbi:MAG: MBL fold metallo-hydrolase [Candidatus Paceibacterota bacterium]
MTITKYGQCCLLIEVGGERILTDPGRFSVSQNEVRDIDLILITHEHADHLHAESLNTILKNNPNAQVVTNVSVGKILDGLEIKYEILEGREVAKKSGVELEAYDGKHTEIYKDFGQVQNTGYFIANKLFYPGDAYTEPGKEVEVLALPIAGPWCCSADAIAYALRVNPKKAFPVHDWLLNDDGIALTYGLFEAQLKEKDIEFVRLHNDETKIF